MTWDETTGGTPKADAIVQIKAIAADKGLKTFKVFYDGTQVVDASDLPETVNMENIQVSAVMDQA